MANSNIGIGLINPKSPTNVGAVMRSAGCFKATHIRYTGERFNRATPFYTDTQNAVSTIPLKHVKSLLDGITEETTVVCVELVEGATPLPDYNHPENALYIFGPEDGSISQKIINRADNVVYIPTIGCLNLAQTVNIVLYDRAAKLASTIANDDLVRRSRDSNNRLKIKAI